MITTYSKNSIPIRIPNERWEHIIRRHPEMTNQIEKVMMTIAEPDIIQEGDSGELLAIRFFPKTPLTQKYLVAAYREISSQDGFVLTSYFTIQPSKRRKILWKP